MSVFANDALDSRAICGNDGQSGKASLFDVCTAALCTAPRAVPPHLMRRPFNTVQRRNPNGRSGL